MLILNRQQVYVLETQPLSKQVTNLISIDLLEEDTNFSSECLQFT